MSELKQLDGRRVTRRKFLKGAGAAAGALTLANLGIFGQQLAPFINIGALMPLTGGLAEDGPRFQVSAQIAIDEMNAAGGPFRFAMLVRDDGTSDNLAATNGALQLIASGATSIFGPAASTNVLAAQDVTAPNKVVIMSPSSTSLKVRALADSSYIFRATPNDGLQARVLAKVAVKKGYKKIAIIARNDAYGSGLAAGLASEFQKLGGTVTSSSLYDLSTTDFSAQIAAAKAGGPEAISLITFDEGQQLIKQLDAAGVNNWDLLVDGNKLQPLFDALAQAIGVAKLVGKIGTASANFTGKGAQIFAQKYQAAEKESASAAAYLGNSYDSLAALMLAYVQVAQLNGGKVATGTELRDHMRDVTNPANPPNPNEVVVTVGELDKAVSTITKGGKVNYEGAASTMDFASNNDVVGPIGTWYIDKNGKIQELETVSCGADSCGDVTMLPPSS